MASYMSNMGMRRSYEPQPAASASGEWTACLSRDSAARAGRRCPRSAQKMGMEKERRGWFPSISPPPLIDRAMTTPPFAARAGVGLLFQTSGDGKIVVKEVVKGGSAARSGQVRGARAPQGTGRREREAKGRGDFSGLPCFVASMLLTKLSAPSPHVSRAGCLWRSPSGTAWYAVPCIP